MNQQKLKYASYSIALQEVPDEISLVINITGCPYKCDGCHSEYLWDYYGEYLSDKIDDLIAQYKGLFTCVCFMGGDQNMSELLEVNEYCKWLGYKTCLYSGSDDIGLLDYKCFDYIKLGAYMKDLGGLDVITTNQKMYKLVDGLYVDITYRLQNRKV